MPGTETRTLARICISLLSFSILLALSQPLNAEQPNLRRSFQPLQPVAPPVVRHNGWVRNPIDAFVVSRLEQSHLAPVAQASRLALLRRVTFDLTGLPPGPEEIREFIADRRPEAYQRLLERLLASARYGERWGRHWLDLARYADTGGFEKDLPYPNAWKFRDYVIRSLNENKPVDRFIQEQIAGDELWPEDPEARIGTAFFSVGPASQDSALNSTQLEYEWLTDCADTAGAAFMGLTLGCARCHNHKYDPISQQDYFAVQAIFAASDRAYPPAVREHRIKGLNGILSDIPIPKELLADPRCTIRTDDQAGPGLFHRDTPMPIHRLKRGELGKPLELVEPALPAMFGADKKAFDLGSAPADQRRAVLARWLVSRDNPLTARVLVNRVWAWHFGRGIVRTPNDFGAQGEAPTHPELLDWLANDFIDHGWDLKRLHRVILTSATYQLASSGESPEALAQDPENRLLSHFTRSRLDAESVWDSLHAAAGTLNLKQFGPPVVPELSKEELSGLFDEKSWMPNKDPSEFNRRGVYIFERRTFLLPMFDAFDPPDVMSSCPRRFQTIVPTQALALLNSTVAQSQARAFARRLLNDCDGKVDKVPARAWLLAFGRPIHPEETRRALQFLRTRQDELAKGPERRALSTGKDAISSAPSE
ncbi:MAG TPA: DUF1549 and DUF1553 domain-containing protein, partial [Verrucomicrobiae bacterium]|nr:DUF1549 and DUF1553 domain-containing protein [Verrucomicrobiae bacterium]